MENKVSDMWRTKIWRFKTISESNEKRNEMKNWIAKHEYKYEIKEIIVNNAWAVQYRKLKIIGAG